MEDLKEEETFIPQLGPSPLAKSKSRRSLSDCGTTTPGKVSPLPYMGDPSRRTSKDDSGLRDLPAPVTPRRSEFPPGGLSLQMPSREYTPPPAANSYVKTAPLSPQVDHSHIYASPTNIVPRRSRGLDFSRAATSLHHSTLAGQSSPDASPTLGGKAMNIPTRRGDYGRGPEQVSTSLWSMMGNREKMNLSHSLGSTQAVVSDSSSSSDGDDPMDEDMEDNFVMTPQANRSISLMGQPPPGAPFGSPAMGSLMSFQQRQRHRKHLKKKTRGPLGLGFQSGGSSISNSPPNNPNHNTRRESISWQANQLHISGADAEENARPNNETESTGSEGQRNVTRRAVTRRGNLLPKTKTFARIRAVLAEEGAPAEAEFKREAEVVRQVRDSDVSIEPRRASATTTQPEVPAAGTALSSPNQETLDGIPEDDLLGDLALGLSSSFKQQAVKNSKGKTFWDTFSESGSVTGLRTTPPPMPPQTQPRGSSSGMSEDMMMDSPSQMVGFGFPQGRGDGPIPFPQTQPPSAAEITRRINNKRRRDSDFDPISFKRRAVSPGLSVHNSPLVQSPMQRDGNNPFGSRPGSNSGERNGSSAPSESGSAGGNSSSAKVNGGKGRIGYQGMNDTNEGIMRMSIE